LPRRLNVTAKQLCPIRSKSRWLKFLLLCGGTHNKRLLRQIEAPSAPADNSPVSFQFAFSQRHRGKRRGSNICWNWSLEKYLDETEKLPGCKLFRAPLGENGKCALEEKPLPTDVPHAHIGVAIPVGQITPKQLLRLADLADNCGSGEIRLTVWQNLSSRIFPMPTLKPLKRRW
jgi:hypothetical protein